MITSKLRLPIFLFFAFMGLISSVNAQLGIDIELTHNNYLQYENIFTTVTLRNYSGHPIAFGESKEMEGKLTFEITNDQGRFCLTKGKEKPLLTGIVLQPGATKQITVNLSSYYSITTPGKYRILANVSHAQFNTTYASRPATFSVSMGVTLWQRIVGVPNLTKKDNSPDKIASRIYKIISLFDGKDKLFYLTIDDEKNIYSVKRIGYELGGKIPDCEIDSLSRIHILQRLSSTVSVYLVYDINGTLEEKAVYKKSDTSPALIRNPENGMVVVSGGEKAKKNQDYNDDADVPYADEIKKVKDPVN